MAESKKITIYAGIKRCVASGRYEANVFNPETQKNKSLGTFNTFKEAFLVLYYKEQENIVLYYTVKNLPNEKWKDIIGYEGEYMISNMGRVKSVFDSKEKLLSIRTMENGRKTVRIFKPIKQVKTFSVARLMAVHFVCENLHKKTLAVIDGEKPTVIDSINYVTKRDIVITNRVNKTGYAGVYKRENGRYRAKIDVGTLPNGKQRIQHLGTYDTPKEAGEAYLEKKFELEYGNMKEITTKTT